ncbi:MAG: hypothetical protein HY716_16950 [Planctomycetes bacterium]|nr:hypothetical protein [Planctomycetota bacterium]
MRWANAWIASVVAAPFFLIPASLAAQDWIAVDPVSKGAGNAGVALLEGPAATCWNPSSLARATTEPFSFAGGYGFSGYAFGGVALEGDVLADAGRVVKLLDQVDYQAVQERLNNDTHSPQDVQDAILLVDTLLSLRDPEKGMTGHVGGGFDLKIGVVGFDDIELKPQVRMGADVDVLENESPFVEGIKSRHLGGGLELGPSFVKFRAGLFDNVASSRTGPVLTTGLGFNIFGFTLDGNAQAGLNRVDIETGEEVRKVPDQISFSAAVGMRFGF